MKRRPRNWNPVSPKDERTRTIDGEPHVFGSKAEAEFYDTLRLRELACEVSDIKLQPRYDLAGVRYTADFAFWEVTRVEDLTGRRLRSYRVVEVKSKRVSKTSEQMRRFRRNQKQMLTLHGIDVQLVLR